MKTNNVVTYNKGTIQSLTAFPADDSGKIACEDLFAKVALQHGAFKNEIPAILEEKLFEQGEFQVFMVESTDFQNSPNFQVDGSENSAKL